jgi:hypothetical protein
MNAIPDDEWAEQFRLRTQPCPECQRPNPRHKDGCTTQMMREMHGESSGENAQSLPLVRLRGQVEILRTDQNQIPAHEPMGWDEACRRVLELIDEANTEVSHGAKNL